MTLPNFENLSADHIDRLRWFQDNAGRTTGFPAPLRDGLFLSSKPKGIYKPRDLRCALSIRINLDSKYLDGVIAERADGSWSFAYHQENPDPLLRDKEYTNLGLMECIKNRVPVGVLQEIPTVGRTSKYRIVGLAVPVHWSDGFFYLEGLASDGAIHKSDILNDVILATGEEATDAPLVDSDYDARVRLARQIVARRGQKNFRTQLLLEYQSRCVITGTAAAAVLEAAHIQPYRGDNSNRLPNGLLLRADIHTLFDLRLIAIEPAERKVRVSKALTKSEYASFEGLAIRGPQTPSARPDVTALEIAWREFLAAEGLRP